MSDSANRLERRRRILLDELRSAQKTLSYNEKYMDRAATFGPLRALTRNFTCNWNPKEEYEAYVPHEDDLQKICQSFRRVKTNLSAVRSSLSGLPGSSDPQGRSEFGQALVDIATMAVTELHSTDVACLSSSKVVNHVDFFFKVKSLFDLGIHLTKGLDYTVRSLVYSLGGNADARQPFNREINELSGMFEEVKTIMPDETSTRTLVNLCQEFGANFMNSEYVIRAYREGKAQSLVSEGYENWSITVPTKHIVSILDKVEELEAARESQPEFKVFGQTLESALTRAGITQAKKQAKTFGQDLELPLDVADMQQTYEAIERYLTPVLATHKDLTESEGDYMAKFKREKSKAEAKRYSELLDLQPAAALSLLDRLRKDTKDVKLFSSHPGLTVEWATLGHALREASEGRLAFTQGLLLRAGSNVGSSGSMQTTQKRAAVSEDKATAAASAATELHSQLTLNPSQCTMAALRLEYATLTAEAKERSKLRHMELQQEQKVKRQEEALKKAEEEEALRKAEKEEEERRALEAEVAKLTIVRDKDDVEAMASAFRPVGTSVTPGSLAPPSESRGASPSPSMTSRASGTSQRSFGDNFASRALQQRRFKERHFEKWLDNLMVYYLGNDEEMTQRADEAWSRVQAASKNDDVEGEGDAQ